MKAQTIEDKRLDAFLEKYTSDIYYFSRDCIYEDGIFKYRESKVDDNISTKSTAQSLIRKEPCFDYSFCEKIYEVLDTKCHDDFNAIKWARPESKGTKTHTYQYQIDLHAAYAHVCKYERLPIDGHFYDEEDPDHMNFYIARSSRLKPGGIVTDELADYIGKEHCTFLFGTDYKIGSKIGDKLIDMVFKDQQSKADAKQIHWGYFQRHYITYDAGDNCYVRNPKNNHELFMVAILSHLAKIMLMITDIIGIRDGHYVTDAYHWDGATIDAKTLGDNIRAYLPNYDFRIFDGSAIVYQTYDALPCKYARLKKSTSAKRKLCASCILKEYEENDRIVCGRVINCQYGKSITSNN